LVDSLKATQLCFSCAHGRPTTVPLVDLRLLRRALAMRAAARLAVGHDGGIGCAAGDKNGSGAAEGPGGQSSAGLAGLKGKLQGLLRGRQ